MRYIRGFALALTLALLVGLAGPGQAQKALKIFMVPKFTGAAYFAATEKGAKEAVAELKGRGVAIDFLYTGPSVANTDEEIRMIDDLVAQKPDAIIISANDAEALVPVAKKAKAAGIKVITYDADVADPTARHWFVNQGTFTLVEAAEQAGLAGKIVVTGLSTPNDMREFVKKGTVKTVVLWNPVDLGYLAVYVAHATITGTLKEGMAKQSVPAGRLGTREATTQLNDITAKRPLTLRNVILLGAPFRFTKENIDKFNF